MTRRPDPDAPAVTTAARALRAGLRPEQVASGLAVAGGLALGREPRLDDDPHYRCPACNLLRAGEPTVWFAS